MSHKIDIGKQDNENGSHSLSALKNEKFNSQNGPEKSFSTDSLYASWNHMSYLKTFLFLIYMVGISGLATAVENDWMIVPQKRVGNINANSKEEDLIALFGKENVRSQTIYQEEGSTPESYQGTVLWPENRNKCITIVWENQKNKSGILYVKLEYVSGKSLWHFPGGISVGTTLTELENQNREGFILFAPLGFSEYGATVSSWNNGKLNEIVPLGQTQIRMYLNEQARTGSIRETLSRVAWSEDSTASSKDKALREINPVISTIRVNFEE